VDYPYGAERWPLDGTFPTDYRFTGQRGEQSLRARTSYRPSQLRKPFEWLAIRVHTITGGSHMLEQTGAERVFSWLLVAAPLLILGWWLFRRAIIRSRHLIYVILPASLFLANLVLTLREPLFSTWSLKLLFSVLGAALVMIPVLVILRLKNVQMDQLDEKKDR
jgi:hypothetical protein